MKLGFLLDAFLVGQQQPKNPLRILCQLHGLLLHLIETVTRLLAQCTVIGIADYTRTVL